VKACNFVIHPAKAKVRGCGSCMNMKVVVSGERIVAVCGREHDLISGEATGCPEYADAHRPKMFVRKEQR
jgi:hypothetical protein